MIINLKELLRSNHIHFIEFKEYLKKLQQKGY